MTTRRLAITAMLLLMSTPLVACDDDGPSRDTNNNVMDAGSDAAAEDSGSDAAEDATSDSGTADVSQEDATDDGSQEKGCLQVEVSETMSETFFDSPVAEYSLETTPAIAGQERLLSILFERYMNTSYEGTFELGTGADANFGTCAHCLYIRGDTREHVFFADRGTLVSNIDPFSRRIDVSVTNLRLVESTVGEGRSSTPIDNGTCIAVADFTHKGVYPPESWTCPDQNYDNGEACNCECGAYDPDCSTSPDCLPGQPGCSGDSPDPLPVVGCDAEEICVVDPINQSTVCSATCDWEGRSGCDDGKTCVFDSGAAGDDLCFNDPTRIQPDIEVGETCARTGLQSVCNVNNGFAEGYCGPNDVCRSICLSDSECTEQDHTCRKFLHQDGLGYCGPEPVDG